jgi:hypothetical protein
MAIHAIQQENRFLARIFEPLEECMTPELAKKMVDLRADSELQARIDELADKCTEGELTSEERAEYESYVHGLKVISVLQAQARSVLRANSRDS